MVLVASLHYHFGLYTRMTGRTHALPNVRRGCFGVERRTVALDVTGLEDRVALEVQGGATQSARTHKPYSQDGRGEPIMG